MNSNCSFIKANKKMLAPTSEVLYFFPRHPCNVNFGVTTDVDDLFIFEWLNKFFEYNNGWTFRHNKFS